MARADVMVSPDYQGRRSSIVGGSLWMVGLSLVVGGYKVGGTGRALTAAVLPAIVVGLGLWVLLAVLEAPIIGFLSGIALIGLILFSSLGLLIGAAIGGAIAGQARGAR
jgi:hypothetical protein